MNLKKTIALMLALTTAASMAVTAVADTTLPTDGVVPQSNTITFDKDANGVELNASTVLAPGKTYYFPVKLNGADLTSAQHNSFKFRYANEAGKRMIESIKIEKYKSLYQLTIKTRAGWPTEVTDVAYSITVTDSKGQVTDITAPDLNFQVGYKAVNDGDLTNADYVIVSNDAPVITEEQFDILNESVDGRDVTFANDDWEFNVRVNGMKDVNMVNNSNEIDEIVEKFLDNEFKFVSFPAGPEFRSTGTLKIDVSREFEDFGGKFFVYRYLNGKLSKLDATVSIENETLSLKTKQLGRFVITNKEIKDNTIIDNSFDHSDSNSNSNSNSGSNSEKNPDTGANDFVGLAVALASVSAAGIAVATKKKK